MARRQTALVTGASSGIGEQFARALADRGWDLLLVARSEAKLRALAEELRRAHGCEVQVLAADLARPGGVELAVNGFDKWGRELDLLVNNAGVGTYGPFHALPLQRELEMIDLNVRALVALTGHFLPAMLSRGRGGIIQLASTTSFQPVPYMATYAATKGFVLYFGEAIAREVKGTGVRVLTVCPGHTPTGFQRTSGVDRRPARTSSQTAQQVVQEALEAWEGGGGPVKVTGWPNRVTTQAPRFVPRKVLSWAIGRAFKPRG
jgi:hypothetical protein